MQRLVSVFIKPRRANLFTLENGFLYNGSDGNIVSKMKFLQIFVLSSASLLRVQKNKKQLKQNGFLVIVCVCFQIFFP